MNASTIINPRTYGSTLWCAFTNRYTEALRWGGGTSQQDDFRTGFIKAVDDNLGLIGGLTSLAAHEATVIEKITAEWPEGHSFPAHAFPALNEAFTSTRLLARLDTEPNTMDLGPGWSNTDLFAEVWAWAKDVSKPMPPEVLESDNPIDTFRTILNANHDRGLLPRRRVLSLGTDGGVKSRLGLVLEEKVRCGWESPEEEAESAAPAIIGACYTCMVRNPSGARIDEGDIVKVMSLDPLRVRRWQDGEWTWTNGSDQRGGWYVSREHLSLLPVPSPEHDVAVVEEFAVGDLVEVLTHRANSANVRVGERLRVSRIDRNHEGTVTSISGTMEAGTTSPGSYYYFEPANVKKVTEDAPVEAVEEPTVEESPEVRSLKAEVESLRIERDRLRTWQGSAVRDVEKASRSLIDQANRRGWCSEYDEIMDGINSEMSVISFDEREQDFEIEVEWSARVTGTYTVSVTARSREDAVEQVENDPSAYMDSDSDLVVNEARYGGVDDFEVESIS